MEEEADPTLLEYVSLDSIIWVKLDDSHST
jgi:hypothetical protein